MKIDLDTMLLAGIYDKLSFIAWSKTVDAQKNINRPQSVLSALLDDKSSESNLQTFASADDFNAMYQRIIGGIEDGN